MKALRALLADRRRRQSGSVLSAVLIIVAFLAIISGALMTALSTNFLLSNNLVNRVNTEATVSSAAEMYINQLQQSSLNSPCPVPAATQQLNGQTAVVFFASCAAVIDRRSPQSLQQIASSSKQFQTDGTHVQLNGLNDYMVGDAGGNVFDYTFGRSTPRWTLGLGGSITGTPLVMPDPGNQGQFLDLIPVSGSVCAPSPFCVSMRTDDRSSSAPDVQCTMPTPAAVTSQPAVGINNPAFAFIGDSSGMLYVLDDRFGDCEIDSNLSAANPIVAGPVVFACKNGCGGGRTDEVYALTSSGGTSHLVHFTYTSQGGLNQVGSLSLPWANPSGIAVESTTLPSRLAISFGGGQVAEVQIDAMSNMNPPLSTRLPAGIGGAPYWCHCPSFQNLIGFGGDNGTLYILDTSLATNATYSSGQAIRTAPATDGAGNWYFGADDGRMYEVQMNGGSAMSLAASYGTASERISSSTLVGACPVGICVYMGAMDGTAQLASLDARNAVLTACINAPNLTCTGTNPRLWTRVEIGVSGNPQTVHVQGWSYYSP